LPSDDIQCSSAVPVSQITTMSRDLLEHGLAIPQSGLEFPEGFVAKMVTARKERLDINEEALFQTRAGLQQRLIIGSGGEDDNKESAIYMQRPPIHCRACNLQCAVEESSTTRADVDLSADSATETLSITHSYMYSYRIDHKCLCRRAT
jgi:hypothetical protein